MLSRVLWNFCFPILVFDINCESAFQKQFLLSIKIKIKITLIISFDLGALKILRDYASKNVNYLDPWEMQPLGNAHENCPCFPYNATY